MYYLGTFLPSIFDAYYTNHAKLFCCRIVYTKKCKKEVHFFFLDETFYLLYESYVQIDSTWQNVPFSSPSPYKIYRLDLREYCETRLFKLLTRIDTQQKA